MGLNKGFKQTEIGLVPKDWEVVPFANVMTFQNGVNADKSDYGKGIPFVNVMEVIKKSHINKNDIPGLVSLRRAQLESFSVKKGDLLFNRTSETQEEIGLISVYTDDDPIVFGGFVIRGRLIDSSTFNTTYSGYGLRAAAIRKQIISSGQGAVRANIGQSDLRKVFVAIPSKLEQEAIANTLSDIDAYIGYLEKTITKKRLIKHGVMGELLTGKRRLEGFKKTVKYKETEVGIIPDDWQIKPLPQVCNFRSGKAHEQFIVDDGPYVCVNSKFISSDGKVRKFASKNFSIARKNDILMVMSDLPNGKALAKVFMVDQDELYAVNQRVCALTSYKDDPFYLGLQLNRNSYFLKFDDGVSQTHLLNRVFEKCPVLLPSTVEEQKAISKIILEMNEETKQLELKIVKARFLKQGMMGELLTGRIRLV